ncbi:MAG: DUF4258 domain-containing protein [Chloroflexi bacterium]|nr:DUF4258 domain-containing protein [Chloroflexota bacterium]
MKPIRFSEHAILKIKVLEAHGLKVRQEFVQEVVSQPDKVMEGYQGRQIAQKALDPDHVLRVVLEEQPDSIPAYRT